MGATAARIRAGPLPRFPSRKDSGSLTCDWQWCRREASAAQSPTSATNRSWVFTCAYLSYVLIAGRAQWLAGAVARTDDRGAYRIPGLGRGRYAVSLPSVQATLPVSADVKPPGASAGTSMADLRMSGDAARAEKLVVDVSDGQQLVVGRHAVPPPPAPDGQRTAYPITFFSNVSKPSDATPLDLGVGEDRVGIDLQLRPVRTTRVSGRVEGPADAVGNLPLRLIPVGLEELGQGSEAATTVTLPDGRFSFLDVPAGSYVLDARHLVLQFTHTSLDDVATAVPAPVAFPAQNAAAAVSPRQARASGSPPSATAPRPPIGLSSASMSLNERLDDSSCPPSPGDPSGRFDGHLTRSQVRRRCAPCSNRRAGWPRSACRRRQVVRSAARRRSRFDGLMAGEYVLRINGAVVRSITWDGQDYTVSSFDASAGRDFTDVVVTVTTAASSLSGVVNDGGAARPQPLSPTPSSESVVQLAALTRRASEPCSRPPMGAFALMDCRPGVTTSSRFR